MGIFPAGTYDLFLTHAWCYTDEWQGLVALIDGSMPGQWRNWSLPWHDTSIERHSQEGRAQLEKLLRDQITQASGVIVLPETIAQPEGRLWLDKQLAFAIYYSKPLIGVLPENGGQFPSQLAARVNAIVPRDSSRIIATLNRLLQEKTPASFGENEQQPTAAVFDPNEDKKVNFTQPVLLDPHWRIRTRLEMARTLLNRSLTSLLAEILSTKNGRRPSARPIGNGGADSMQPVLVEAGYKGYNIVCCGRYYGILPVDGPFDIWQACSGGYHNLVVADRLEDVVASIDRIWRIRTLYTRTTIRLSKLLIQFVAKIAQYT